MLIATSSFNAASMKALKVLDIHGINIVLNPFKRRLKEKEVIELLRDDVIGVISGLEPLNSRVLKESSALNVISRCGTGTDNVDDSTAKKLGILVYSTPDGPTESVAELAVGLMLSVLRKISLADRSIRSKKWNPLMGGLLRERTVGIVGLGRIGSLTSKILSRGFGCRVLGFDPFLSKMKTVPCIQVSTLEELLRQSDIISLHLSAKKKTKPLMGHIEFSIMQDNSILINTSRGTLVDETALTQALDQGKLAGAGLDVFDKEPYQGPLLKYVNVVMTMHMGSYAREARKKMESQAVQNLLIGLKEKGVLK